MGPKIDTIIRIPTSLEGNFFRLWISCFELFHELTDRQIDVIVKFLKKRYELSQIISDEGVLDSHLMSDEIKKEIRGDLGMSAAYFQVIMSQLRKKKLIVDGKLNTRFYPPIKPGEPIVNLLFHFELNDVQRNNSESSSGD